MFTLEELLDILKMLEISPEDVRPESRFFEDLHMEPWEKEQLANYLEDIYEFYIDRDAWDEDVFTVEDALRFINGEDAGDEEGGTEQSLINLKTDNNQEILNDLLFVRDALIERGYSPVPQITGYIMEKDPTYITQGSGARSRMMKLEPDEILEELLVFYLNDTDSSTLKNNILHMCEYAVKVGKYPLSGIIGWIFTGDPTYLRVRYRELSYKDQAENYDKYHEASQAIRKMEPDEVVAELLNAFFSKNE